MRTVTSLEDQITGSAIRLEDSGSLDPLMEQIGDAKYVLLGEASHGTHEYYVWRARLSRRLIEEKGFSFVAVEGDWPDCFDLNCWVKGYSDEREVIDMLNKFDRWPTWMWANWEVAAFLEWMRSVNTNRPDEKKIGFYGLDVYSLYESLESIMNYFRDKDPETARKVREAFQCFEPYNKDIYQYARKASILPSNCEDEVIEMLKSISSKQTKNGNISQREADFNAEQNALVAVHAEEYYRKMVRGGNITWNIRDQHMMETLNRLMALHGPDAKAIVWEHNTHIGDARYTDMASEGMFNIGQLARQQHENEGVRLVGFGSYCGTVIAGEEWGSEMEIMDVPEGRRESWEWLLHETIGENCLLLLDQHRGDPEWMRERGHRAIGVVYHPSLERYGNYVTTILPGRYDAFIYIDETKALHPLHMKDAGSGPPELYPFGV
jgi:erythromycin esterase-like protein